MISAARRRRRPRRSRRGTLLLWFLLVALPVLLLACFLAVDLVRIVAASRVVSDAAEAVALGAAQQFRAEAQPLCAPGDTCVYYTPWLDEQAAATAADDLLKVDRAADGPLAALYRADTVTVTSQAGVKDPDRLDRVSVRIEYTVRDLSLIPVLNLFSAQKFSSSLDLSVTRTADVCTATYAPTGGACTRPVANP